MPERDSYEGVKYRARRIALSATVKNEAGKETGEVPTDDAPGRGDSKCNGLGVRTLLPGTAGTLCGCSRGVVGDRAGGRGQGGGSVGNTGETRGSDLGALCKGLCFSSASDGELLMGFELED